ncbi:MAG: GNAT family N-acetyltransferase [Acidobacteriota bacterium]
MSQTLHPAQRRALAYLRRRGTEAPFGDTIDRMRSTFEAIESLLDSVSEEAARRRPASGRWSVQEVADHLIESHRPALDQWRAVLAGHDPGPAIPASLISKAPLEPPFRSVRASLRAVHRAWLTTAAGALDGASDLDADGTAPVLMVIRGEVDGTMETFEWVEPLDAKAFALAIVAHTREHIAQIASILDALGDLDDTDPGPRLASARLRLRPVVDGDIDDLHRLFDDPGVRRYLFDDARVSREQTTEMVAISRRQFASRGHGLWVVEREGYGRLVGFGGFWFFFEPPQLQLLYGLHPDVWGQGLATELAGRLLDHGFDTLGFDAIVGATDPPNIASIRVMEKLGMERWREEETDGKPTVYLRAQRQPN